MEQHSYASHATRPTVESYFAVAVALQAERNILLHWILRSGVCAITKFANLNWIHRQPRPFPLKECSRTRLVALVRTTKVAWVGFGGSFTLPNQHFLWFDLSHLGLQSLRYKEERLRSASLLCDFPKRSLSVGCAFTSHILATFHPTPEINNQPINQRRKDSFIRQWWRMKWRASVRMLEDKTSIWDFDLYRLFPFSSQSHKNYFSSKQMRKKMQTSQ